MRRYVSLSVDPVNNSEPMRISKSRFMAGVQCLKRLYWQVHEPELAAEPDAAMEAIIQQGREVGMLARQMFPGGVEVCTEGGLDEAIRTTRELVTNPEVPAIFEGVFEHGSVLVRVDVLHRRKDGRWRLIEVKSSTEMKEEHFDDVGIQYRVVSRSVGLASACLAHVNRNYVYQGGDIDPRRFFRTHNLTRRVQRLQPKLTFQLRSEFQVLEMSTAPEIKAGPALHESGYLRVLYPMQSDVPARSHRLSAPTPSQRVRRTGGNGHRLDPRHPERFRVERDSAAGGYMRPDGRAVESRGSTKKVSKPNWML